MERRIQRRRRPALSCIECRRRKIRCDRNEPCAHCVGAKIQCIFKVYPKNLAGEDWAATRVAPGPSIPLAPGTLGHRFPRGAAAGDVASVIQPNPASPLPVRQVRDDACEQDPGGAKGQASAQAHRGIEDTSLLPSLPSGRQSNEASSALTLRSGRESPVKLKKTRMLKWSDRMGNDLFASIFFCYKEASGDGNFFSDGADTKVVVTQTGILLKECKKAARRIKACRPSRSHVDLNSKLDLPPRSESDAMVKSYLKTFESVYRILHVPTFWHEYQQLWTGDRIDLDVQLKIFLVIAIGSSIFQSRDTALEGKVHQWISAAQNWLSGPLEKDRLTITGLQVYCLTLLARQIFSIGGDLIWISSGSLVNQAMQMGLHRDPRHFAAMSVLQAELRRRLWATVLEIALQSSLDTAMSPRISVGDFDTAPPANINDDDLDESTTNLNLYSAETYTMTSDQLLLFRSMPVRLRALHFLNDFGSEQSYLEALELTKEILDACKSSSAFLARCEVSTFRRNLLDYLQRRFLLPLHCSFANQARAQPLFYYSLKVSLDAAIAIIAPPSDEEYSRLLQVGGGLFREGLRYASITIGLEVLSQAESARENSPSQPDSHRGWAKAMLKRMIDQSLERICSGETNVKNHMFLSMVLAQAGALEAGEPSRLKLAQAAHDSLEYCNRLLQSRVAALPLIECLGMGAATSTSDELGDFGLDLDFDYFMLNGI